MGDSLLAMLSREGVDVGGLVRTAAGQTSASVIPVRPNGDRPAWHCVGANATLTLDDLDLDQVIRSSHLHPGGPEFLGGPAAGDLLLYAKDNGLSTSVEILAAGDPGLLRIAEALPHTDYLLRNDEQVLGFTGPPTFSVARSVCRPPAPLAWGSRGRHPSACVRGRCH